VLTDALTQDLQELLESSSEAHGVPGAVVGISQQGCETFLASGVASVETASPVDADTMFHVGSTTKTVTATAALALAREGLLSLDAPVRDYLPEFELADRSAADGVLVRHLLTHRAGFMGDVEVAESWDDGALRQSVNTFATAPQLFAPGEQLAYSNGGYILLGAVLEAVTSEPYEALVKRLVLDPLGMAQSWLLPWDVANRPHAVGHVVREDGPRAVPGWGATRAINPAGGLVSTARDQLRYAGYHLDGTTPGTAPLPEADRLDMQSPQGVAPPPLREVGMPWLLRRRGEVLLVEHGGNFVNLQISGFLMVPERQFAVTVLTNANTGQAVVSAVNEWCLEQLLGLRPEPVRETLPMSPGQLTEYEGVYDVGTWRWAVLAREDGLQIDCLLSPEMAAAGVEPLPSLHGVFVGTDELASPGNTSVTLARFSRDCRGDVEHLLLGGRISRRIPDTPSVAMA
jgi:CubicO group peptidase (beta-lactamase class C family)